MSSTPTNAAEAVAATIAQAVDTVNPGAEQVPEGAVQVTIDAALLDQAKQMKNARLIASMVHENAVLEVALEQERRAHAETKAKYDGLKQSLMG